MAMFDVEIFLDKHVVVNEVNARQHSVMEDIEELAFRTTFDDAVGDHQSDVVPDCKPVEFQIMISLNDDQFVPTTDPPAQRLNEHWVPLLDSDKLVDRF